jgi:hypothetical protein
LMLPLLRPTMLRQAAMSRTAAQRYWVGRPTAPEAKSIRRYDGVLVQPSGKSRRSQIFRGQQFHSFQVRLQRPDCCGFALTFSMAARASRLADFDVKITGVGIVDIAGEAFAQGGFLDEDARDESAKDQRQNKKADP